MDSKINKKRLSDFLAYEWILIIILCVVAIVVWELIYTVSAIRLTTGQDYKFFYDKNTVYSDTYSSLYYQLNVQDDLGYENGETFSFEIQKIHSEEVLSDNDILYLRLSVKEGDMLFTDDKEREVQSGENKYTEALAKSRVDSTDIPIATLDGLLAQAKAYLKKFLTDENAELKYENFDQAKIQAEFDDRLGGDNRFRSSTEKATGLKLEQERLQKLCVEVQAFERILSLPSEYFFNYTRFAQSKASAEAQEKPNQENIDAYAELVQKEMADGRENARYGLKIDKFNAGTNENGKKDVSTFFRLKDAGETASAENVVIMVFDFIEDQPALQFESIVVINNIVRACSTILD